MKFKGPKNSLWWNKINKWSVRLLHQESASSACSQYLSIDKKDI